MTCGFGYMSANSMAHIPVPVPTSRTWRGSPIGAAHNLPFSTNEMKSALGLSYAAGR
jgi:hypothetical protein